MEKEIWARNFYVKNASYVLASAIMTGTPLFQESFFGKKSKIITKAFFVTKGLDFEGYYEVLEIKKLVRAIIGTIADNPKQVNKIHQKTYQVNDRLFNLVEEVLKKNLDKLSPEELANVYASLFDLIQRSQCDALASTWFVDSNAEEFSKLMIKKTRKYCRKNGVRDVAAAFSILTTPASKSILGQEEVDLLKLVKKIQQNSRDLSIFKSTCEYLVMPAGISADANKAILDHYEKWRWIPFGYIGPSYDVNYFIERIANLVKSEIDPDGELNKIKSHAKSIKLERQRLFDELGVSVRDREIFDIAADIINLKAYRKDTMFFACYAMQRLLKEIGKRFSISLNQIYTMTSLEIIDSLCGKDLDIGLINKRNKLAVTYYDGKKFHYYVDKDAALFIAGKKVVAVEIDENVSLLTGTCACSGCAKGIVRIVNESFEMIKMKDGDIMVSHTTFPSLVPAMKKAAAIITEDGGITCHAAIVSRELKIPCVTGIRSATKVLKDGDQVKVDASKGIVRIIKRYDQIGQ